MTDGKDDSFAFIDNPDLIEIGQKFWIPAAGEARMADGALMNMRRFHPVKFKQIPLKLMGLLIGAF